MDLLIRKGSRRVGIHPDPLFCLLPDRSHRTSTSRLRGSSSRHLITTKATDLLVQKTTDVVLEPRNVLVRAVLTSHRHFDLFVHR